MKTLQGYIKEQLKNPEFAKEYEALDEEYEIIHQIIRTRIAAGLTLQVPKYAGKCTWSWLGAGGICAVAIENGGARVYHGSGGIIPLRAA